MIIKGTKQDQKIMQQEINRLKSKLDYALTELMAFQELAHNKTMVPTDSTKKTNPKLGGDKAYEGNGYTFISIQKVTLIIYGKNIL